MDILRPAPRRFYEIPSLPKASSSEKPDNLFSYINENVIGNNKSFHSPFGTQKGMCGLILLLVHLCLEKISQLFVVDQKKPSLKQAI